MAEMHDDAWRGVEVVKLNSVRVSLSANGPSSRRVVRRATRPRHRTRQTNNTKAPHESRNLRKSMHKVATASSDMAERDTTKPTPHL